MIKTTKDQTAQFIKMLVHAPAGSGKTRLCATAEKPLIISAEGGLLSLREYDLPFIEVKSLNDLRASFNYILENISNHDWICLDSISEIAETCLAEEKKSTKDGRMAYGNMQDKMTGIIRDFRDLPINVYMSAKQEMIEDPMTGVLIRGPAMPGKKLSQGLAYFFDEVFTILTKVDENGVFKNTLLTRGDGSCVLKDRSGALSQHEPCSLAHVRTKILQEA